MGLRTIVAISKKTYSTAGTTYKVNGFSFLGLGLAKNAEEWLQELISSTNGSGGGLTSSTVAEFNNISGHDSTLEIVDTTIAKMLGFTAGVLYTVGTPIIASSWGSSKLVLQNAENLAGLSNSIMQSFEEMSGEFQKNVVILRGFPPISDYEADNDREIYKCEVRMFPASRREDLKTFFDENTKGISETVNIYGLTFKIAETLDLNINMDIYSGIKDQYSNKNLKEFDIGFIVEV